MAFKDITNAQITDAMPRVGDDTPDALRPTIALTHDLLKDLRDNDNDLDARAQALEEVDAETRLNALESGLTEVVDITAQTAIAADMSWANRLVIAGHSSAETKITLPVDMVTDKSFSFTVYRKSGDDVTFWDDAGTPEQIKDIYGFGTVTQGGLVTCLWDGEGWSISGGLD